jgi:hypothetical protein
MALTKNTSEAGTAFQMADDSLHGADIERSICIAHMPAEAFVDGGSFPTK